jgi:hypothetical protein
MDQPIEVSRGDVRDAQDSEVIPVLVQHPAVATGVGPGDQQDRAQPQAKSNRAILECITDQAGESKGELGVKVVPW